MAALENQRAQARVRRQEQRNAEAAEEMRLQGNAEFSAARYDEATSLYTRALELAPRSAVLYANRAMALLKPRALNPRCNTPFQVHPPDATPGWTPWIYP